MFTGLDWLAFAAATTLVIVISLYASRKEETGEDYFLAGRKLTWGIIGFSLIASNISTEHFVGMAGRGFELGLAIASYEWMAAVMLVLVAFFFLPKFLRAGIYTMPEYLEYRYNVATRTVMTIFMMLAYVFVALATVLYSGALAMEAVFGLQTVEGIWIIGLLAGLYTVYGGSKAVAWSDMLQCILLLLGGVLVTALGFRALGGVDVFFAQAGDKLHTVLPWDHPEMPWVAVFVGGLWIPNLFYWGLNQFITQRTLGARSLEEGQKGILLAALLKLLIPFIIVFPGIMAALLYPNEVTQPDQAYPILIRELVPLGLRGFMLAALMGAVMSTLAALLNSAATIFTIDLYQRHWKRGQAAPRQLVTVGRLATAAFMIFGCLWAPIVARTGSVFQYIQMFWGFISPGITAAFLFGLFSKRTPPEAAIGAMLLGIPVYGLLLWKLPDVAFLHHMMITFLVLAAFMATMTKLRPLSEPPRLPNNPPIPMETSPILRWYGVGIVALTALLYGLFW